jgi:hypothetical protein
VIKLPGFEWSPTYGGGGTYHGKIREALVEREVEWPEPEEGDDYAPDEALFDSTRGYLEQLPRYHAFQGKGPNGEDCQREREKRVP